MGKYFKETNELIKIEHSEQFSIEYCDGSRTVKKDYTPEHYTLIIPLEHAGFEVSWCNSNEEFDEKILAAGSICLIPAGKPFSLTWCNAHYLKLEFSTSYINKAFKNLLPNDQVALELKVGFHDNYILTSTQILKSYLETQKERDLEYLSSWVHVLVGYILQYQNYNDTNSDISSLKQLSKKIPNHQIQSLLVYIDLNLDKNLSVKDMANYIGMSKYHFIRVFKKVVGIPPARFIALQRVNKAKNLLTDGIAMVDIAYQLGFSSQSHLSKSFSTIVGMSPREYLKEHNSR